MREGKDEQKMVRKTEAMEKQQQKGSGLDINDLLAGSGGKEGMEAAFGKIQQNLEGIGYKGPATKKMGLDERTRKGKEDKGEMREGQEGDVYRCAKEKVVEGLDDSETECFRAGMIKWFGSRSESQRKRHMMRCSSLRY